MQENRINAVENSSEFSLVNILYKNAIWIVLAIVIGFLAGLGVAAISAKPTYTATKRVMFITKYSEPTDDKGNKINSAGNDLFLAKIYLPNAIDKIRSPLLVADANEIYKGEGNISSSAISARYGEESLIFSLSYTDSSAKDAVAKLDAIIESAKLNFPKPEISVAKDSTLRPVENKTSVAKNSNFGSFLFIGAVAGLVISVAYLVIKEVTDVTIKDRNEVEALTGVSLLACIDDAAIIEKRRIAREKQAKKDEMKRQKGRI